MVIGRLFLFICMLAAAGSCTTTKSGDSTAPQGASENEMGTTSGTGTIRYLDLEGGFYGIVADNGQRYDPGKLEAAFEKDGLRVRFVLRERTDVVSFRMWGRIVEVVSLEVI